MKETAPRLHYGGRPSSEVIAEKVIELHKKGKGPLSIAVRLGVNAKVVLTILVSSGVSLEYEPQCYRLNRQLLP